jgi:hypothetical protein
MGVFSVRVVGGQTVAYLGQVFGHSTVKIDRGQCLFTASTPIQIVRAHSKTIGLLPNNNNKAVWNGFVFWICTCCWIGSQPNQQNTLSMRSSAGCGSALETRLESSELMIYVLSNS